MPALDLIQLLEDLHKLEELEWDVKEISDCRSHTDPVPGGAGEGRVGGSAYSADSGPRAPDPQGRAREYVFVRAREYVFVRARGRSSKRGPRRFQYLTAQAQHW